MSNPRIEKLQSFLLQSPEDPFLHHALALEYVKESDDTRAKESFERNRRSAPGYVATYYHLGKLLERSGQSQEAMSVYEQGMQQAKAQKDMHSYSELQAAYEDLAY